MRTMTTRKGRSVTTDLTEREAVEIAATLGSDFSRSLVSQYNSERGLSEDQMTWVYIIAEESRPKAAVAIPSLGSVAALADLFATAGRKLKYPKVRLTADGRRINVSPVSAGHRFAGSFWVVRGESQDNSVILGRIDPDGAYHERNETGPETRTLLAALLADPIKVATEQGRLTGHCSFCDLPLDDERSTAAGYGPVCAKHWGLPWGTEGKAARAARVKKAKSPAPFVPAGGLDDEPDSHFDEMALASVGRDAGWY